MPDTVLSKELRFSEARFAWLLRGRSCGSHRLRNESARAHLMLRNLCLVASTVPCLVKSGHVLTLAAKCESPSGPCSFKEIAEELLESSE